MKTIAALLLVVFVGAVAADKPSVVPHWTENTATILLVKLDTAQPGATCRNLSVRPFCAIKELHGQVLQVLKDAQHLGLQPGVFEAEVLLVGRYSLGGNPWLVQNDVRPGQQYLLFSNLKSGLRAMIEAPSQLYLVPDDEDATADIELILKCSSLTLREQALAVSEAIDGAGKPRSFLLGQHAGALLAAGSDAETGPLAQSIEKCRDSTFSAWAGSCLLAPLWRRLQEHADVPDQVLHMFITMSARGLVASGERVDPDRPDGRRQILRDYVPWIVGSERAKAVLRVAPAAAVADRLRRGVLQAPASEQYSNWDLAQVKKLADILRAQ